MPNRFPQIPAGTTFGNDETQFELLEKIGEGGQGQVFVCRRLGQEGDRQVRYAAKVIPTVGLAGGSRGRLEQLRQEILIMERLHHPRVVNMHANFWEPERVIIVMDLAPEGDLFDKMEQELAASQRDNIPFRGLGGSESGPKYATRQFLDALGYMHHRNVTHRDLKAENILIHGTHPIEGYSDCKLYDVKIADFGLSKFHDPKADTETPGGGGGTRRYAAPERFRSLLDSSCKFDERLAEFWSLGVIIYLTLCARFPYAVARDPERCLQEMNNLQLDCEPWQSVSLEGQQFVKGLLTAEPGSRLCLDWERNCLVQPWLAGDRSGARALSPQAPLDLKQQGVIRQVRGWVGDALDRIEFCMRDGPDFEVGSQGGTPLPWAQLQPEEVVIAAMQESRDSYLGNSAVLYTSESRIIALEGKSAKERARFIAPRNCQIVGLQFDSSRLIGIHLEPAVPAGRGAVEEISGRCATCVDNVRMKLRDGSVREWGVQGGNPVSPFTLQQNETIVVVEQLKRDWFLGSALVFYTSAGRVFKIQGVGPRSRHFAAPHGQQIRSLRFEGNVLRDIICCPSCPGNCNR